jgi:hypothetical protein
VNFNFFSIFFDFIGLLKTLFQFLSLALATWHRLPALVPAAAIPGGKIGAVATRLLKRWQRQTLGSRQAGIGCCWMATGWQSASERTLAFTRLQASLLQYYLHFTVQNGFYYVF